MPYNLYLYEYRHTLEFIPARLSGDFLCYSFHHYVDVGMQLGIKTIDKGLHRKLLWMFLYLSIENQPLAIELLKTLCAYGSSMLLSVMNTSASMKAAISFFNSSRIFGAAIARFSLP